MITRACKKNLVIVSNLKSDTVEEAYLFLRDDAPSPSECKLLKEAEKIVSSCSSGKRRRISLPSGLVWFSLGAGISGVAAVIFSLLL